ncbi:MAG: DUF371 domain-containing protein [Catenulispora sp.]|nr:DUF371 domain-containing protein [Catenulispora sp.]
MSRPLPLRAVLVGRGHPAIRATHAKTFELTAESALTARATCVLAVGTVLDPALAGMRGRVRLTLATAGLPAVSGEATLNPLRAITDRVVVRRSRSLDPDTLAVGSTLTAEDLPAAFAAALTDPDREVSLTVEELGPDRPLLRVSFGERTHLPAMKDLQTRGSAELVIAEDAPAKEAAATTTALERVTVLRARVSIAGPYKPLEALLAAGLPPHPYTYLGAPQRVSTLPATPVVFRMPADMPAALLAGRDVWVEDTAELDLGTAMDRATAGEAVVAVGALAVVGPAAAGHDLVDLAAVARALTEAGIPPRTLTDALSPLGLTRKKLYALFSEQDRNQP